MFQLWLLVCLIQLFVCTCPSFPTLTLQLSLWHSVCLFSVSGFFGFFCFDPCWPGLCLWIFLCTFALFGQFFWFYDFFLLDFCLSDSLPGFLDFCLFLDYAPCLPINYIYLLLLPWVCAWFLSHVSDIHKLYYKETYFWENCSKKKDSLANEISKVACHRCLTPVLESCSVCWFLGCSQQRWFN